MMGSFIHIGKMSRLDLFVITMSFIVALGGCESPNRRRLTAVINQDIFIDIVCPCNHLLIRKYPFIEEYNKRNSQILSQSHYYLNEK